jgi:LmbE family N-acetylglucosaminyl deacetylase
VSGLLCICAHPDDELYGAGLFAKLARQAVSVYLVCLTRGEGGGLGDPPIATRETLGEVREGEMRCAAEALGVTGLEFLDYIDPVGDGEPKVPVHEPGRLMAEIIAAIEHYQPEVVLTHGSNGEYGHPAHRLLHKLVKEAVVSLGGRAPLLYSFNAFCPDRDRQDEMNVDDPVHFVVDVMPYIEQKIAAFACHRSQREAWVQRRPERSDLPATLAEYVRSVTREAFCRHWPAVEGAPDDVMRAWLQS